jgi:hypothetical protein
MKMKIEKLPNTEDIAAAVKENGGYCICAIEKIPETKCMCKAFVEQKESGVCHCGLYKKTVEEN